MRFLSLRTRKMVLLGGLCAALLMFPCALPVNATGHGYGFGFGRGIVRAYPAYGWGWGGWGWGGPFWGGYWPYDWNNTGTVKFESVANTDEIYINGSYAGLVKNLRSIHLSPGTYRVTVKDNGKQILDREVYVMRGKTIKLEPGDKRGAMNPTDPRARFG